MKAPMNAASRSVPVVLIALAAVSLGACGQKGPLYLPGDDNAGNSRDRFEL